MRQRAWPPRSRCMVVRRRPPHCVAARLAGPYSPAMFEARFQTFDDAADAAATAPRIAALRAELARRGLDGFIVPIADRHQNEYVPPRAARLAWLTGFTGSAGPPHRLTHSPG